MKRIILFFTVCLGLSVFQTDAVFGAETSRTTAKRNHSTTSTSMRSNTSGKQTSGSTRVETSRTTTVGSRATQNANQSKNVSPIRPGVKNRTASDKTNEKNVSSRSKNTVISRSATRTPQTRKTLARSATPTTTTARATRTVELDDAKIESIKSKDYSKCKTVYYDCMDEFCAAKDADLRRCACSARINEFDDIKKQLDTAEDKMLDFNQRLLLVGLDKEDATAVNIASDGEKGYSTKDTSESEKLLKKITNSLNTSNNTKLDNSLAAISLSLDFDSAWDSVDSLGGISTTSKNGLELYNAARPVCVEMAREICSEDELEIAQNSYKLSIQQDCNTVAKSYNTKYNQAMEKIHESGALLDMARLDAYQQRNSDDILTCKQKILDQLSTSSVCGSDLHKCLDISGRYINPADGSAFLSTDLYNITTLLTSPTGNETWSAVPQNKQFVSFLNSKKTFLDSATAQCQDIADSVWKDFLNDALAQIKLAQNAKLEEIRQSCTTLVAECRTNALTSLTDFDARALSTFEVMADSTVNALCSDVENSCASLLASTGGGGEEWESGITEIATDISYDAILNNCTTVGRDCIIQQCNGTAGNFALCSDYSSAPRRAILRHSACWNEVMNCVRQSVNLANITNDIIENYNDFYTNFYAEQDTEYTPAPCNITVSRPEDQEQIYACLFNYMPKPCDGLSGLDAKACLITEKIWGNCEYNPATIAITTNEGLLRLPNLTNPDQDNPNAINIVAHNKILQPKLEEDSTLLSWFAYNTGTSDALDSCSAYNCPINYKYDEELRKCKRMVQVDQLTTTEGGHPITMDQIINISETLTNYCDGGMASKDIFGNCCASAAVSPNGICIPDATYNVILIQQASCDTSMHLTNPPSYYCPEYGSETIGEGNDANTYYFPTDNKQLYLYCVTTSATLSVDDNGQLSCDGILVVVDQYGNYITPATITENSIIPLVNTPKPKMIYHPNTNNNVVCTYEYDNSTNEWTWGSGTCETSSPGSFPKDNEFTITYE